MADLQFQVYAGSIPGSLTIDLQANARFLANRPPIIFAPLNNPVLKDDEKRLSQQWGVNWVTPMTQRLNAIGGAGNLQLLTIEAPSLDTTDLGWFGTGSMPAITDPYTVELALTGSSIYGRTFQAGDYVIVDDPTVANGRYSYEIDQVIQANGNVLTLKRSQQGQPPGFAYFGSVRAAHSNCNVYRLLDKTWHDLWDGSPQVFKFLWDGMVVSAVQAFTPFAAPSLVNLFPIPPATAAMGLVL